MVTLRIDDDTFAAWSRQAAARGLSVEDWLKRATIGPPDQQAGTSVRTVEQRLQGFDRLTRQIEEMRIGSGGILDDSRETIYSDRGL
jgi:hypothetical protein